MTVPGIRIGKMAVRLSGLTAREAGQRAGSIAREIARSLAADRELASRGRIAMDRLRLRIPAGAAAGDIPRQIRGQLDQEQGRK